MTIYKVSFDLLREMPITKIRIIGIYEFGDSINTGGKPFKGEDDNLWIRYAGRKAGFPRYECYQFEIGEKYYILIYSQNKLDSKENEIKINFKENWVQKDNSKKEKETEEKNKLIINMDITNPEMFEEIEDIECNNFISPFFKENEFKSDDINSISICQNQQNQLIFQNIKKNDISEFSQSQGSCQINFSSNPFHDEKLDSSTLNSEEFKKLYFLPQDKNLLNSKVKRENPAKIMFISYEIKVKTIHTKFAFDNMMKTVKSSSIDIIINILNIKVINITIIKNLKIMFLIIKNFS